MIRFMVMAVWYLNGAKHLEAGTALHWFYNRVVVPLEMRSIRRKLAR